MRLQGKYEDPEALFMLPGNFPHFFEFMFNSINKNFSTGTWDENKTKNLKCSTSTYRTDLKRLVTYFNWKILKHTYLNNFDKQNRNSKKQLKRN